jgi:predicted dehydrogenase
MKVALIGTGSRGCEMWGKSLVSHYSDHLGFVGLCDNNSGRLQTGKKIIGAAGRISDLTTIKSQKKKVYQRIL